MLPQPPPLLPQLIAGVRLLVCRIMGAIGVGVVGVAVVLLVVGFIQMARAKKLVRQLV